MSLNGRQYVGGAWTMTDTYEWAEHPDDCPLYVGEDGFPDASNNICNPDAEGTSLLGHAEAHNYPWWFSPVTASAAGSITVTTTVTEPGVDARRPANCPPSSPSATCGACTWTTWAASASI